MKRYIFLLAVVCMTVFSGCAEKKVDYDVESSGQNAMTAESSSGVESGTEEQPSENGFVQVCELGRLFPKTHWREEWEAADSEGNKHCISIDAEVSVPDADGMSVIELVNEPFTAAYKEQMMRSLFGSETIYYYDDDHKTKEQWQRLLKYDLEPYIFFYEKMVNDSLTDIHTVNLLTEILEGSRAQKTEWETRMQQASIEMTAAEDFNGKEYLAYLDGTAYTIKFFADDQWCDTEEMFIDYGNQAENVPEELQDAMRWSSIGAQDEDAPETDGQENQCRMSLEEAKAYAEQYAAAAGIPCAVCTDTQDLVWIGEFPEEKKTVVDGYYFVFKTAVDDVVLNSFGTEMDYGISCGKNDYRMQSVAYIGIRERGLAWMKVINPVTVTNITGQIGLLPYDTICEIMRDELNRNVESYLREKGDGKDAAFNQMELVYFRLKDRTQSYHYTYVPAWRLSWRDKNLNLLQDNCVMINAIDGSIIHPREEYTGDTE